MTPEQQTQLNMIKLIASQHLDQIGEHLPAGYTMTLICRRPDIPDAQIILTDDTDLNAVAKELVSSVHPPKLK